jgi:hypothetical protein
MKKLILVCLVLFGLTGCASRYAGPAIIGGVIGYSIANSNRTETIIVQETHTISPQCDQFVTYNERNACERGARRRWQEEQRKRENEAYHQGYRR